MKISPLKVILAISILANAFLVVQMQLLNYANRFNEYYYHDFTGMIINSTREEISKGNIEPTLDILKAIPLSPEYKDLTTAATKFLAMKQPPAQAEQGVAPNDR